MSYNSKYKGTEIEELLGSIGGKQEKLISGSNIKTVNGVSILGSGDIKIEKGLTEDEVNDKIASAITTTLNTEV